MLTLRVTVPDLEEKRDPSYQAPNLKLRATERWMHRLEEAQESRAGAGGVARCTRWG